MKIVSKSVSYHDGTCFIWRGNTARKHNELVLAQ